MVGRRTIRDDPQSKSITEIQTIILRARPGSITLIPPDAIDFCQKSSRRTRAGDALQLADLRLDAAAMTIGHIEQIRMPIRVEIGHQATCRPDRFGMDDFGRHVKKGSITVVLKQTILPIVGDIKIGKAIVIEVARRDPLSKGIVLQPSQTRNILPRTTELISEQPVAFRIIFGHRKRFGSLRKAKIRPSVAVIIQNTHTSAGCFNDPGTQMTCLARRVVNEI